LKGAVKTDNDMARKRVWAVNDEEKLGIAASCLCVFVLAIFSVLVYFGEAPKQIPTLLATGTNVYFMRNASLASANYVDLALSTLFFSITVALNAT
jgi:hypothetical protein